MNIKSLLMSAIFVITAQMTTSSVHAEILSIGPNAQVLRNTIMPRHGQSMSVVTKKFGKAIRVSKSQGKVTKKNPRITRWDYANFSVYFENSHVIHSVARR